MLDVPQMDSLISLADIQAELHNRFEVAYPGEERLEGSLGAAFHQEGQSLVVACLAESPEAACQEVHPRSQLAGHILEGRCSRRRWVADGRVHRRQAEEVGVVFVCERRDVVEQDCTKAGFP